MACSLNNKEDHLEFLAITALELKEKIKSLNDDENLDIDQYVRDIYQEYVDDEFSEEDAAQYAQFVPNAIKLALSYDSIAYHVDTKKLRSLVESFEEFENVLMFTMPKINQERIDEIIESIKKDGQEIKDPPPTSSTEVQEQSEEVVETQEYKGRAHILTGTTGQEGIVDETKPPGKGYTDVRNPEEEFYYGIFRVFTEAMGKQRGVLPADLEINGHTGFKLKIISKQQVSLTQARLSDQRLVRGEIPGIPAREGGRRYYGGIGAVLTDAAGNMLYFDKNYKITTKSKGKLIYHNLRNVTKNKSTGALTVTGYQLQSIENSMSYYFTATDKYSSIKELKEKNKTAYDTLKAYVESVRETQKELMYQVRNFVNSNKKDSVLVDITGISRGFLNIEKSANTDINSIDWANSDVKLSVTIADINNDELGEVAGNPYIRIPNSKSIPFQRNNLGTEQVEGIINLLFDDIMQVTRGKKSSIPNDLKETLITNLIRLDIKGIQIINNNKEWKVKLKTKKLTGTEEDRQAIRTFLSTLSNERNSYNNEWGKFRFKKPTGNNIKEFTITDGVATITNKAFDEHVIENSTLEVKPNTKNQILFLNGYFTFSVPLDEQAKFGTELEEKEIPAITEEDLKAKDERQVGVIKKTVKDYFDNSKDSLKNLKEGVKAVQQIIKKNGTDWESYTESDQKVIKETFTNIAKVIPQVAALILPVPGTATLLQILKSKSKAINKLLTYTFQALENYKSTASVGDAEATEKVLDDMATDYEKNFKVKDVIRNKKKVSVYQGKGLTLERQSHMVTRIKIDNLKSEIEGLQSQIKDNKYGLAESTRSKVQKKVNTETIKDLKEEIKVLQGKINELEKPANEDMNKGASVGNFVDVVGRDVFADETEGKVVGHYLKEVEKDNKKNGYTVEASQKVFEELRDMLDNIKKLLIAEGWTFKSKNIFVYSEYSEAEKKASGYDGVGGMLDLVGIDPSGRMHIIDFKNMKYDSSKKKWLFKNVFGPTQFDKKVYTWGNQQGVYKFLAEKEHDLDVESVNILPISTTYSVKNKVITLEKVQITVGPRGLIDVKEGFQSEISEDLIQLEEGEVLAEVEKKFEETQPTQTSEVKEGVSEVFSENPKLSNIGSEQQYSDYLDTIFPDSKVKEVLYHMTSMAGKKGIEEKGRFLKPGEEGYQKADYATTGGIYFTDNTDYDEDTEMYGSPVTGAYGSAYVSAILNIKNPLVDLTRSFGDISKTELKDNDGFIGTNESKEIGVLEPEQIHILGSKQDIEGFKKFISKPTQTSEVKAKKADVILPIGTSGSGKSTFIKSLPQENLVVISPDDMRVEFTGDINDKSKDKEIYIEAAKRAIQAIKNGKQVVFDTTNLTKEKRRPFIEAIKKAIPTVNIQYKLMELNPELAKQRIKAQIARGENRANVPDATIDRHAESYKQMLKDIKSEPITDFKSNEEINAKYDAELDNIKNRIFTDKNTQYAHRQLVKDLEGAEFKLNARKGYLNLPDNTSDEIDRFKKDIKETEKEVEKYKNRLSNFIDSYTKEINAKYDSEVGGQLSMFKEPTQTPAEKVEEIKEIQKEDEDEFGDIKLYQEPGRASTETLPALAAEQVKDLQDTVENQLLEDEASQRLGWKSQKPYIVLSPKTSEQFESYLKRSRGALPTEFHDNVKDVNYVKSNNRKNSLLYDVVDYRTGELIREKVRLFLPYDFVNKDKVSELKDEYGLNFHITKQYSAKRSINFALYRQLPNKAKFVAQAKKYLYAALKLQNVKETGEEAFINLTDNSLEELLSMFPDEMWDYINTTYTFDVNTNVNASTSRVNKIGLDLPKLGLIKELEKQLGISILNKTFVNRDRSGSLAKAFKISRNESLAPWGASITITNKLSKRQLRAALGYYLTEEVNVIKPSSQEENIRKYAEHNKINYEELQVLMTNNDAANANIAYNTTGNSNSMEISKWREAIRNYNWQVVELFNGPLEKFNGEAAEYITEKFKDKMLSNNQSFLDFFFSGNFNWLNINFNSTSGKYWLADDVVDENVGFRINDTGKIETEKPSEKSFLKAEESYNRLAAVLHEPFHALHALSYGSKEEREMKDAFDKLKNTEFGKKMLNEVFGTSLYNNKELNADTIYKEFTAFTFQLMNYPKQWLDKTDLRSNDIQEFIEKVQNLQDKTYKEIETVYSKIGTEEVTISAEEKLKLNFLQKLYNVFIKALRRLTGMSKPWGKVITKSKLVNKTVVQDVFGTTETEVTKTKALPQEVKKAKQDFIDALDDLKSSMESLMNVDTKSFSSENISNFFKDAKGFEQEAGSRLKSSPEAIAESKEWFENHVMSEFIGYEELFDVVNSNAFAEFIDGGIRLYKGSDHTVLYHEAWHGFTQHFLPTRDKLKLYNETLALEEGQQAVKDWAKKKNVNILRMSQYQKYLAIEEFLAEDFRQYKLSGDTKVFGKNKQRQTIFRRIMNFLKHIFGKLSGIKSLSKDYNTYQVQEMYKKLSIGAINEYTHSAKNMMFTNSALYKAIEPVEGNSINISDQDSLKIVSAVDSIISGIIDTKNKQLGNTMFTSALFTMPEVIMKSGKTLLETMYGYIDEKGNATGALGKFIDRRDALLKEADALKGVKKKRITDKADILSDAINNWGNLREGVIAYHVDKSPFLGEQLKNIDKDTFTKTKEDVDSVRFDKAGNDLSMMDLTSNQVLYLIKSIKDRQKDGTIAKDEFGFDKLVDYKITWKKLIDALDENNDSPREIHAALIENSKENPWMNDLLNKLGPVVTVDQSSFDLWTGFWSAFYLANWGLYQVSAHVVQEEEGQETGARFEILVGYASAVFKQAERDFRGYFKQVKNHKYITNTSKGNELDWKVLDDYRGTLTGNEFQFLRDIGIPITDKDKIKEGLKDVRVDRIYDTLKRLRSQGIVILDVIEALKLDHKFKDEKSGNIIPIASEAGNINKILNLETRHSGVYANTAVGTPDGKIKFEQTQMSTLSVQQRAINKSKTFNELIALPHMQHLSYKNNPAIIGSMWMKSLYEFNEITKLYGKKIPGVEFKVDDLSGTQTIVNKSYADLNYSSATSKSDKYTRLIQDIYSGLLDGRFSTMVHADKSTVLAAYITTLNVGSDTPHLYVDPKDFTRFQYGDGDISAAVVKAFDMLMPYLEGELTRIARVESKDSSLPRIPGYTIKDKKGNISGNKLAVFDNIFIKTKDEILKAGSIENIYAISEKTDLADRMLSELQTYFDWSTKNTKETLGQMIFADETMTKFIKDKTGNQSMPLSEVQDVMLETYTMNTFLHHIESINIMYGDLAQYNMLKEEFHKRNAGIASTGRMFRTDQDAYDYINSLIGRPLAEKLGYKVKDFDGTLDTAVLKENVIPSKMVTHPKGILFSPYGIALKKDIKKKYPKAEAAKVKTMVERILKPYTAMEEGDGQGWMSFDTYRILSMLSNRWTKAQEMLYFKIIKDPESVSLEDVHEYFPPRKYQYFGPLAVENIGATAFHKYSLVPIIPSVITGKNMEVLHDNMMKQGIDYAVFDSGSKVSTVVSEGRNEGDQLYVEGSDREMVVRDNSPEQMYAKNTIFLNYLKDQLDINSHFKNKVIFSTQMRKLIEEGLVEGGVPVDFMEGEDFNLRRLEWHNLSKYANDSAKREAVEKKKRKISPNYKLYREYEETIIEAIEYRKEELRQEIGSTEKELAEGKGDMDKLVNFIRRELDRQDLADHEIDFIKSDENGNMVYDLSMTPSASRIERALNAIVNNRIIRQKVNGEPLVQIAGTMFEATNPTKQDLEKYGDATNDLKTYIVGPDGNTLGMEVKVALQGNFEVLIHLIHEDGDKIAVYVDEEKVENGKVKFTRKLNETATIARLNETINNEAWRSKPSNAELITMTGVRIPVQGHNSMEFMLIKEFLPKAAGNIIIPPSEIVAKSGSDFDIDKLTIMMANIAVIGGVPEVIKETRLSSVREKFDRTKEIKVELKELRKSIAEATLAYENAYDKLSKDGLTDEEAVSVKQMKETYQTERDLLNKELNTAIFNEERLEAYEKLTDNQYKLLEEAKETIQYTGISKEILAAEYARETSKFGSEIRQKNIDKLNNSELVKAKEKLQDKYNDLSREVKSYSGEAIENTLMYAIRDILQLPQNFINLITPNSTNLLQGEGSIVEDLAQFRDYKATMGVGNVSTGSVSPTRVLEPAYNIYKHESNAVGKDTLGLAAIDNTYNTVLTRIGAYLNPTYFDNNKSRRAVIKMEHNKLNILEGAFKGEEGISLSHLYDVKGENKVSDVINQLLNGWLDVAKDAWIFDIQGNKQITPTLMFLLQAGVPLETAIYFVSNPLVKEYVTQQKIATSAYARFLGVQPENDPTHYRSHAKDIVLDDLNLKMSAKDLYNETVESTKGKDFTDSAKDIAHMSYVEAKYDDDAKAAFLHFLELEKTSEGIKDIKMKMNYDTAQSTDLFDAQRKEADLRQLYADSKTPNQVVDGILNDSTIGGFRIADFQLSLWGPLFKIRSHKELNDFLIQRLSSDSNKMKRIYYTEERYVEEFKNAFIMRMFSKAIKDFDINADSYKGLPIRRTVSVESTQPQTSEVEITSSKNIFTVEPIQAADKKAKSKAKIATQYIGFAEGIAGSSTASYAKQAGQFANTGAYTSDDVIFVSIGGKRGSAALQKSQQDRTIKEAIKAVETGAIIITDNKRYTDASTYNTGEKRLYENMKAKGYYYSEVNVDGNTLGTWSKPTQQTSEVIGRESIISIGYNNQVLKKNQIKDVTSDINKEFPVYKFSKDDLKNPQYKFAIDLLKEKGYLLDTSGYMFTKGGVDARTIKSQPTQQTRKGVTPIHSDRGVIVKPNAKGEMTIYISEDVLERQFNGKLYQRDGSFTTGIDKVADRKFNYKTLGLAKVEEVAFLYGTAKLAPKKTEYFRFVIEREFLRVTNPFSEMSKTRYFEYKYNANKKKYKKPANTTQEDFETRLLKFTYEEMLRDSALNNILNYWKLFMSKDSMANQLIEMKEMNPTLEEDYSVVNDLILSEGKVQSKNDLKGKRNKAKAYTNIVLRDNKVDKDIINVYHSNLLDLADPSKRKITISRKNTEQDKIENQRISEFFKMLPLVAFLQSGLNTMDNLSITRIIPTQQITDLIDPLINDYIKELDKPNSNLLLNFYNQFNAVNNISNISIRKRLQNYVTIDNKESVSYNLTNSNVVAEHSIPMNFEDGTGGRKMISKFKDKSTFDLIISGDRTGTSRSPRAKKNVKRGDIIEFTKDIPEKRDAQGRVIRKATVRQLLVRATSDEYPVSDVSSKTWSELEGWDVNGYSKIVDLDYVQFTFELLDIEELADKKIKEEGVGFIEIGPANKNELEILIKNNPNVIFVLEGSTSSTEKGSYVEGMGKIGEFNNVVNIDLRNNLSNNKEALWNITDNEKNKVIIDESMTRLEKVFNTDKSIALLSPRIGYGAYLASTSPSGSMVSSPTFDHLSSELYAKFKYNNKNSNVFGNVQTLMKESQQVDDFQLEIPIEDLIEARERLTCK